MTQREAIQSFVKRSYRQLMATDASLSTLRDLERIFFSDPKIRHKIKRPSTREVLEELYALLSRNGLRPEEIHEYVSGLPVFGFAGDQCRDQLLNQSTKPQDTGLKSEHLELIKQVNAFHAATSVLTATLKDQKLEELAELEAQIEQKKDEYRSLPSVLDEAPVQEPTFDPSTEDVKAWWERFYLKGDPFPRKDGLSDISKEMYDAVLVRTKPFEDTLSALERNSKYLLNTGFPLIGDYGYGKTTFIDYLSYYVVQKRILPIRITCGRTFPDSAGFLDNFYLKLRNELLDQARTVSILPSGDLAAMDVEDQIISLARAICESKRAGIVVFLDDYHKHRSHFKQVFEFVGLLQILKDNLARRDVPVGFVVSGTREWSIELSTNGQMAGFLDNSPIEMPLITPELVAEVFNQRIKAYCFDQSPRTIKVDFVKRLFKEIDGQAGFRDYLTRIITELSRNNLSIIDSPIDISAERLAKVRGMIEKDGAVKVAFNKLVYGSRFKNFVQDQVVKCLELLVTLHIQEGITEQDRLFLADKFYFIQLRDVGLIQKTKIAGRGKAFKWVLIYSLQRLILEISEKEQLSPSDYLLKIYGGKTLDGAAKVDPSKDGELAEARGFFNLGKLKLSETATSNLDTFWKAYDATCGSDTRGRVSAETVQRAALGITALSAAFFEIDATQPLFSAANIHNVQDKWELHWLNDESLTEMFKREDDWRSAPDGVKASLVLKQFNDAAPIIVKQLQEILEDIREEKYYGLIARSALHSTHENEIFRGILVQYYSADGSVHFDYIRRLTDYLEIRFRTFLYATMGLAFGSDPLRVFPEAVRSYAYKNINSRKTFAAYANPFDGFTRSQFRSAFEAGGPFKDNVVNQFRSSWQQADWRKFFDVFAEENISVAHQQLAAYSPQDRPRYVDYARMSERVMEFVNVFSSHLLTTRCYVVKNEKGGAGIEGWRFVYAFRGNSGSFAVPPGVVNGPCPEAFLKQDLLQHFVSGEAYAKVKRMVMALIDQSPTNCFLEDLLDVDYIVNHYSANYADVLNSLVYAAYVEKSIELIPWIGSSICVKRKG